LLQVTQYKQIKLCICQHWFITKVPADNPWEQKTLQSEKMTSKERAISRKGQSNQQKSGYLKKWKNPTKK
jgi:hypothetical protein